jgi:hypothetical protein
LQGRLATPGQNAVDVGGDLGVEAEGRLLICDNGAANADDAYGGCTTLCTVGPLCGDGNVDTAYGEECDDGVNQTTYGQTKGCGPGCRIVPYCGDGKVDSLFGEECDDGPDNGKGNCDLTCQGTIF